MTVSLLSRSINRRTFLGGAAAAVAAGSSIRMLPVVAQTPIASAASVQNVVAAAKSFLATVSAEEQAAVLFDWSNEDQKARWSNFPAALYARDGLMWGNLGDEVRASWLAVMQASLSESGYARVLAQWTGDEVLKEMEAEGTEGVGNAAGSGGPGDGGDAPAGSPPSGGPGGGTDQQPGGAQVAERVVITAATTSTSPSSAPHQPKRRGNGSSPGIMSP